MVLGKINLRQILAHMAIWTGFIAFLLYPTIVQGRRAPSNFPYNLCLAIVLFYLNYFVLVPKLLLKKRTIMYVALSFTLLLLVLFVFDFYFRPQFSDNLSTTFRRPSNRISFRLPLMFIMLFCVPFTVSTVIKVYGEWRKNEDLRKATEKEKIDSELRFLKTQLNPHFLFNSLNTIYSLSVKKSDETPEAIMNISELMRYMLYEANRDKVPLAKEINYLKSYVQLQRQRLSRDANLKLKISGKEEGKMVAPMLFIVFIENAFKYGTDFQGKTDIEINLSIKDRSICLYVKNIIGAHQSREGSSGIGIENVRNRLNLLYPDAYDLTIGDNGVHYEVNLHLNLN
ncbi:Histidine kinase [Pricia antarctica]|uniref:Histidine kinase n=2 Tax=Pricia antarctica TaxID=641691 RepID=A0A1G7CBH1_9FLAO|nr:Histidine kinase [Pricia antarctica]